MTRRSLKLASGVALAVVLTELAAYAVSLAMEGTGVAEDAARLPGLVVLSVWLVAIGLGLRGRTQTRVAEVARVGALVLGLSGLAVDAGSILRLAGVSKELAEAAGKTAVWGPVAVCVAWMLRGKTTLGSEVWRFLAVAGAAGAAVRFVAEAAGLSEQYELSLLVLFFALLALWACPRIDATLEQRGHPFVARGQRARYSQWTSIAIVTAATWVLMNAAGASVVASELRTDPWPAAVRIMLPFAAAYTSGTVFFVVALLVMPLVALVAVKLLADDDSLRLGLRMGLVYVALLTPSVILNLLWGVNSFFGVAPRPLELWRVVDVAFLAFGYAVAAPTFLWLILANGLSTAALIWFRHRQGRTPADLPEPMAGPRPDEAPSEGSP